MSASYAHGTAAGKLSAAFARMTSRAAHLLAVAVIFNVISAVAVDKITPTSVGESDLRAGRWIFRSPKTILGAGTDSVIEFEQEGGDWFIVLTHIAYAGVNSSNATTVTREGRFACSSEGHLLKYDTPAGSVRKTFRFDGPNLVMPAIVQKDTQTWFVVVSSIPSGGEHTFRCKSDPETTPKGAAEFPSTTLSSTEYPQWYELERRTVEHGRPEKVLKFLQRHKGGQIEEWCRLIWDADGQLSFRGTSWYLFQQQCGRPLDKNQDAQTLKLLGTHQGDD